MLISPAFAQAAGAAGQQNAFTAFLPLLLIFVVFYFLLIRPQKKEQDRHQSMIAALKKGDEVVTGGGIIGTVVHAEGDRITIKTAETTRIVVERGRIARVTSAKADAKAEAKSES